MAPEEQQELPVTNPTIGVHHAGEQLRSLWRNRDFLLLWGGRAISELGNELTNLAFPALFLIVTDSATQAGLLSAARLLPYLFFGLIAGALVDRWDRRRVMLGCELASFVVVGAVPLLYSWELLSLPLMAALVFLEGTLALFYGLANAAALPRVVERGQIGDASAFQQVTASAAFVLGPALYGGVTGFGGPVAPFVVDALSYLVGAVALLAIRRSFQAPREPVQRALIHEIREGVNWLRGHPVVRFLAVLMGGLNFCTGGFALLVLTIAHNLRVSDVAVGLIFAAGGVGALFGAALTAPLMRRFRFGPLLSWCTWIWVLTWIPFAWTPNVWVLGLVTALGFVIVPIHSTVQYSYRIAQIPDALQGRVNGVFRLVLFGSQALGAAVTGLLLDAVGPVGVVLMLAVPQALLALATQFNRAVQAAR
jgi:MFS family permease